MMNMNQKQISLDQQVNYEIKVPGVLERQWLENFNGTRISIQTTGDNPPVTILKVKADQAGLHGILQRLYALGLPLLSVNCIEENQ